MRVPASRRLILVAALFLLAACRKQPSPTVFVDPALATLMPVDTVFVAGIRVEQLQSTPIYQRYISAGKLPIVESFSRNTGIDLRKNLWEVVIPTDGNRTWVMLRGKFAEMGMEPRISREGVQRHGYKGYTMLGDERMAVLFLNPTTAIAATPDALRSIIDNRDKGTGMPGSLRGRVSEIPSTNQLWFAGKPPSWVPQEFAQYIDVVSGGVDFRSGIKARIIAFARSAPHAQQLRTVLNNFVGAARLNTPEQDRGRLRLYDGFEARVDGSSIHVALDISEDLLDDVLKYHTQW